MIPLMKLPLAVLSLALVLAGCSTSKSTNQYTNLFDGKTFDGWEGDTASTWRIEDQSLVAGTITETAPRNEFLATTQSYTNFVLRIEFKLEGTEGFVNSGIQIRSKRIPDHFEMIGYQVDIGDPGWWGCIYDESRRNKVIAQSNMEEVNQVLRRGDWNQYEIRAEGPRVRVYLNGLLTVDYLEEDESIEQHGLIAVQIHGGGKAKVSFRNIQLKELP